MRTNYFVFGIVMPLLPIIPDSEPIMRKTSRRVGHVDNEMKKLVADMYETMVEHYGVGLAAVQVGVLKRFFIYEIPKRTMKGYEACYKSETQSEETGQNEDLNEQAENIEPESDDDGGYTGEYMVCINPRIIAREGEYIDDEGCLSRDGWIAKVKRAIKVTFQAYDINMKKFERTVEGLEARCVQHEIDHLDGILFTDRAEPDTLREIKYEELETEEDGESGVSSTDETENSITERTAGIYTSENQ